MIHSALDGAISLTAEEAATLRLLLRLVSWPCAYCALPNETSALLWIGLRTSLICSGCGKMQDYPNHIRAYDPTPLPR